MRGYALMAALFGVGVMLASAVTAAAAPVITPPVVTIPVVTTPVVTLSDSPDAVVLDVGFPPFLEAGAESPPGIEQQSELPPGLAKKVKGSLSPFWVEMGDRWMPPSLFERVEGWSPPWWIKGSGLGRIPPRWLM